MVLATSLEFALIDIVTLHVRAGCKQVMVAMLSAYATSVFTALEWGEFVLMVRLCVIRSIISHTIRVGRDVSVRISVELVTRLPIFGIDIQ